MQSYKKIMVGVDFNERTGELPEPTIAAIKKGLWLAQVNGGEVTFVTVLAKDGRNEESADSEETFETQSTQLLDAVIASTGITIPAIDRQFAYGKSWYELIRECLRRQSDLMIVGTRAKNAAQRMLYGSTAIKLIRKCPCAVLVIRPDAGEAEVSTIVAADDLSPVGLKVLHAAVSTAQLTASRLMVVNAVNYPLEGAMLRTECAQEDVDAYREKCRNDAEAEVLERLSMTDYRTVQQGTQVVVQGGPADSVIDQIVEENKADLLVMGTIARGGIPGFLIGNTAERLLPTLQCSLLAIKPDHFPCPIRID